MILHALALSLADLAQGFAFVAVCVAIALLIRAEIRSERKYAPEPEYTDPWASLPPRWNPPEAEARPDERRAA
jgi:hypothetical protein